MNKYNVKRDVTEKRNYRYIGEETIQSQESEYTLEWVVEADSMDEAIDKLIAGIRSSDEDVTDEFTVYSKNSESAVVGRRYFSNVIREADDLDFDEIKIDEEIELIVCK